MYFHLFRCRTPSLALPLRTARHRRARGFTLLEVMVVVAIMGVLTALAAPSFGPLIENWRVRQAAEQLQSTLHYARSEAIKRGGRVVIQKLPNNINGCTSATGASDWDCGWFVCEDTNNNGACNATEPVLQRVDAPSKVLVTRHSGGARIRLNRWGLVAGPYVGFNLMPLNKTIASPSARGVCMSSGGRIKIFPQEDIPCSS